MKKLAILVFVFAIAINAGAQLVAILQFPPSGLTYKPQLWNMVLTNTTNSAMTVHIEVTLTPVNSSTEIFTGVTRTFTLKPGTNLISVSNTSPIQYNILSNAYSVDANPVGLLPIGRFEVCYHFFRHVPENTSEVIEQCRHYGWPSKPTATGLSF